ncbi:putative odorant receptor 83c [Lutzomyia longipalpis]|uniref:putative odorant receptor 83c n=1 Tax=Lutzomyia longipalpis TaxID=7200 RepID=UPI0024841738|nr:putative odorant receptor 83c [Lutzomyia longipalpis]
MIKSYSVMQECPNLLQKILKKHVEMLKAVNAFNQSFKFMSFMQIIMSTILFFTMLFSIQMFQKQFAIHFAFAAVSLQLVFVCVFGEVIRTESEAIFDNLYQTNWYELSVKEQKVVLMIMMNSTNPISIKAGGMYDINLMTLVQILKLSLSYSAMILTLARK